MNWVNILVFVLLVGAPAIGSIWKKLEEKKEQRQIEAQRQRLQLEQLRTGRVSSQASEAKAPTGGASSASADLDAQRRARLEELRRRQQERLRQAAHTRSQGSGQVRTIPTPGASQGQARPTQSPGRPAPQARPTPARSAPARPAPARSAPARAQPQRVPSTSSSPPRPTGRPTSRPTSRPSASQTVQPQASRRVVLSAPVDVTARSGERNAGAWTALFRAEKPTLDELRRAVLLREVFDRPVSMRDQPPGSF